MFSLIKSRLGVSNTVSCWEEKRVVESVSGAFIGFKVWSLAKQKCHMYGTRTLSCGEGNRALDRVGGA